MIKPLDPVARRTFTNGKHLESKRGDRGYIAATRGWSEMPPFVRASIKHDTKKLYGIN